jgi:uncharacterized membrane protein
MTSAERPRTGPLQTSAGRRVVVSLVVGCAIAAALVWLTRPVVALLLGWDGAAALYVLWVWAAVWPLDSRQTSDLAAREAITGVTMELVVLGAGTASLAAVGLALLRAGQDTGPLKMYLISVGVLSVVLSWAVVHTVFTLRYARAYYSPSPGGISFNSPDPPTYADFAYLAFTIGMTFQVSDTNLTAKAVRRAALRHALVSYLFGAVIVALVINIVASIL